MTTPTTKFALHYRPIPRRRKKPGNWTMHAIFPNRADAEAVMTEIRAKFKNLDVLVIEVEQVTNAEGETR